MTRNQYIASRGNHLGIAYEYYKEKFVEGKHSPFLSLQEFSNFFMMWTGAQEAVNTAILYYDAKFEIIRITDVKTGYEIKVT